MLTNQISHGFYRLLMIALALFAPAAMAVNVLTEHNDLSRTGANTSEGILTPANVGTSFGKLFTDNVDAQVYAQPLYVQNLNIAGGIHNVVFVCTESNSVYALDADIVSNSYWHMNLGTPFPAPNGCGDLTPVVGITSTPVIDLSRGIIYVETKLASGNHELHALSLTNGSEKLGGPVTISATGFTSSIEHQRESLLLLNGVVYLGFASHCDSGAYHGFLLGYNATNLSLLYTFNATPTGTEGGIWSCGMAPAADTNGNIYVITGNGTFDGTLNFSMSMIKLSGSLTVEDYATQSNWSSLSGADLDFDSGVVLLPPHYAVGIGKDTNLCLADINNMGHVGNWTQIFSAESSQGDVVGKSPVYWQGPTMQYLFLMHANNPTKSFQYTSGHINTTPLGVGAFSENDRSGGLSLSANGTTNGVLWEMGSDSNLRAYDAVNFPKVLWTGTVGTYVKMACPTIANGKVYVGTASTLGVWGLTNRLYIQSGVKNPVLSWAAGGTLMQATKITGPWSSISTASSYMVSPTNRQTFYRLQIP